MADVCLAWWWHGGQDFMSKHKEHRIIEAWEEDGEGGGRREKGAAGC